MADNQNTQEAPVSEQEEIVAHQKSRLPLMIAAAIVLIVGGAVGAAAYMGVSHARVTIDTAQVSAPEIPLAPTTPGVLKEIYVQAGDTIPANTVVAQVGTELVKSTSAGLVISTSDQVGANVSAASPVVTMIDPTQLRVVGQIDEDKGLSRIAAGDRAEFTVDAFGGKKYQGIVDEVSPTSHASDVVFSISDKRQTQKFDVKVTFDPAQYPELKNGMSARIYVYTK
jgi:multidrug resistance efflux pump